MKTEKRYCYQCEKEQDFQICVGEERVVARESSQPHVEAWGSSQLHVVARESSQPHVVARESSQPHVEARGCVQLSVWGKVIAKVTTKVSVLVHGNIAQIKGGKQTRFSLKTSKEWCDYYGIEVKKGIATLFKAVDDDYSTLNARRRGIFYTPGSKPIAPHLDVGKTEFLR